MPQDDLHTNSQHLVLLIDDDPNIQQTVVACLLQERHISIIGAVDGKTARALINENAFDLILLDLGLPDIEGLTLLRQLKEDPQTADIPVFLLTGRSTVKEKVEAFDLGATDYLTKPFAAAELRVRINSVLTAKRTHDELLRANDELISARAQAEAGAAARGRAS